MTEGKQLSQIGKYKDAISKLSIAESKWSPEALKIEIATEINKNKELAKSSDNFEQGRIQYDEENYTKAIEYFDKVIINDENYNTAQAYKEIAKEKIVKLNNSSKKEILPRIAQAEYPDPSVYPTVNQIQQTQSDNNKDSICKNTASLGRIQFEERAMNHVKETMPEFFSFEEAKKKYPGQYTSELNPELNSDLMKQWAKFSQITI